MSDIVLKKIGEEYEFNDHKEALNFFIDLCGNDLLLFSTFTLKGEKDLTKASPVNETIISINLLFQKFVLVRDVLFSNL